MRTEVMQIDGVKATNDGVISLLVGSDVPGSSVTIKYQRGSNVLTQTLVRASTAELLDRKRMFELL